MEVHLKVQKARIYAGMNQTAFAQKLGLSQNDVWRMENGEKKFVSRAYIDFMLEQGYDLNSLFDTNLDLQKNKQERSLELNADNIEKSSENEKKNYIPLFPDSFFNENFADNLNQQGKPKLTPIDYLHIPYLPKSSGAVRVQCDCMYPRLKPKDIIIFDQHPLNFADILYGETYLISINTDKEELVILRRLQRADCDGNFVKLVNENPKYQSKDVHIEKIQAMALVKSLIVVNSSTSWKHNQP